MAKLRTLLIAVIVLGVTGVAQAQPECPCNCYFSGDCESGNFCNWGSIPEEDSCFWRLPKPQGQIGAGCDAEYNDWGQCDGICSPSGASSVFTGERVENLVTGITEWAETMTIAAASGGGLPDIGRVAAIREIPYETRSMADSMWRVAVEVHGLTRGTTVIFPPGLTQFHAEQVAVKDLSNDPARIEIGNLAIEALVAEIREFGAGRVHVDRIGALGLDALLDEKTYALICMGEGEPLNCLYTRLADMADALGRGGRGGPAEAGSCEDDPIPCEGDITQDGDVGVPDLVQIISEWSEHVETGHPADINGDQRVDVIDLVMVIQNWGACE